MSTMGGCHGSEFQHVAFDVDVALQIGLGDVALVQRTKRTHRPLIAQAH